MENESAKNEQMNKIYNDLEIPILCTECNQWSGSNTYKAYTTPMPMFGNKWHKVKGTCRNCGKKIARFFPMPQNLNEMAVFAQIFLHLTMNKRIIDEREKLGPTL